MLRAIITDSAKSVKLRADRFGGSDVRRSV